MHVFERSLAVRTGHSKQAEPGSKGAPSSSAFENATHHDGPQPMLSHLRVLKFNPNTYRTYLIQPMHSTS